MSITPGKARKTVRSTIGGMAAALCLCGAVGCGDDSGKSAGPAVPVTLIASGDTAGWLIPCGCASNQSGGLLRRGSYVAAKALEGPVLLVDVGGAPSGTSAYHRVKFEAILRGEMGMGLAAHNIGAAEAALGAAELQHLVSELQVPFVATNLRGDQGEPIGQPLRVIERGGQRIGVAGVLSSRYDAPGMVVEEPLAALRASVIAESDRYDRLIVLAYLPEDELVTLASSLPEADAVLGGPTGQSLDPKQRGATLLTSATNKGKFLVEITISPEGRLSPQATRLVEMNDAFADAPTQQANLKAYLAVLANSDFPATRTGLAPRLPSELPRDYRVAGNAACRECHAEDCRLWDASKHAQAWQSLEAQGKHVDPYCQQCHTTGYGLPGGFVSVGGSPLRQDVGCESCHGPSMAHVEDETRKTPFDARGQCVRCHDHENSPHFDYEPYWIRIKHGVKLAPAGEETPVGATGSEGAS